MPQLPMLSPTVTWETAETIRLCIDEAVSLADAGAPKRSCVIWGQIAWDSCQCGQLTVAIGQTFFTGDTQGQNARTTPSGAVAHQSRCGGQLVGVQMTATMLRCSPIQDERGNPPACEALSSAAFILAEDEWRMRNALVCCLRGLKEQDKVHDWIFPGVTAVGAEGGCAGSQANFTVFFTNWCNCSSEAS